MLPAKLNVEILKPCVESIPKELKNFVSCLGHIPAWSPDALTAIARHSSRPSRIAIAHANGEILGVMYCEYRGLRESTKFVTPNQDFGYFAIECALPLTSSPGVSLKSELGLQEKRSVIRKLERCVLSEAPRSCLVFVYRNLRYSELEIYETGIKRSIKRGPMALWENNFRTFAEYLRSLPKKRRNSFQRMMSDNDKNRYANHFSAREEVDPIDAVYLAQLNKTKNTKGRLRPPPPIEYFRYMNHDPNAHYFGYEDASGTLLAFDLALTDGAKRMSTTIVGSVQSSDVRAARLYFDLYLREIAFAIDKKYEHIDFGTGFWETKKQFGCTPIDTYIVVRPRI